MIKTFEATKEEVRAHLRGARSRITLSFDAWKSDNELHLLGIVAHFIDSAFEARVLLLALRNTFGSHGGQEQSYDIASVSREFGTFDKGELAWVIADNATNDDTTVRLLCEELGTGNPEKMRLRCAGHIVNPRMQGDPLRR